MTKNEIFQITVKLEREPQIVLSLLCPILQPIWNQSKTWQHKAQQLQTAATTLKDSVKIQPRHHQAIRREQHPLKNHCHDRLQSIIFCWRLEPGLPGSLGGLLMHLRRMLELQRGKGRSFLYAQLTTSATGLPNSLFLRITSNKSCIDYWRWLQVHTRRRAYLFDTYT